MEKTEKVFEIGRKIFKDYDLTIPDDEKDFCIELDVNNFTPNVNSKLYLKPKNISIQKWLTILKVAKYSSV